MEAAESSLFPGYRLDRYELLCPIASGGMASVWLARLRGKRGFEKLFAIKTIKTELISDQHYQQMFLDEARIASRIVHPNVAQILELGEENDILYLVMEWVDGDSLAKVHRLALKQNTPFPVPYCLRIVSDICAGLHAAHQLKDPAGELLGVVHRDVSPQNVLLSTEGSAKVIDFGLVKAKNRTSAETESGIVKGKIRYMAPEQVGGRSSSIDHRADVWAAGMCLLELVTGKQPYPDLDDLDVVKRLMEKDASAPIPPGLHPAVESVLARALVRDREGRFASCAQMKRALDQAIGELGDAVDTEDVSTFVKENLPDLHTKRARTIARAIEAADTRVPGDASFTPGYSGVPVSPSSGRTLDTESGEIGFAATEVSGRHSPNFDDAMPLTRKLRTTAIDPDAPEQLESDSDRSISNLGASHSTGGALLRDQLGEQKGRRSNLGFWIAALVVAVAGAWVLWPRKGPKPVAADPVAVIDAAPPLTASVTELVPPPPTASSTAVDLELPPATPATSADAGPKKLMWPSGSGKGVSTPATPASAPEPPKKKRNPACAMLTGPPPPGVICDDSDQP